jgi:hypothetical protein
MKPQLIHFRLFQYRYIAAVLIFVLPGWCYSQIDCTLIAGDKVDLGGNDYIYPGVFMNGDTIYVLRFGNDGYFDCRQTETGVIIEKFDRYYHHLASTPVILTTEMGLRKPEPIGIYFENGRFILFLKELNIAEQTAKAYLITLGINGKMIGDPVTLGEVKGISTSSANTVDLNPISFFKVSESRQDTGTFFLYIQQFPVLDQSTLKLVVMVFDRQLLRVHHKMMNLDFPPEYCELSDFLLVNNELFFILTIQPPVEDKRYKLVTYNFKRDELVYYNFSLEGKKIHSTDVKLLNTGNIFLYGLFFGEESSTTVEGLFFYLFGSDNQTLVMSSSKGIALGDYKSIGKEDLGHLCIRDALVQPSGKLIILSELYWNEVIHFTDSEGKLYFKPNYHSDPLFLLSFSSEGSLLWQTWIARRVSLPQEISLGFRYLVHDSTLLIIYNDHPGNLKIYDPDLVKLTHTRFVPTLARVNTRTGVYYKLPFDAREIIGEGVNFRKDYTCRVLDNKLILIDMNGYLRLVELTFSGTQ